VFLTKDSIFELKRKLKRARKIEKVQSIDGSVERQKLFSVSESLEKRVKFWENVYSRYDSNKSILHDSKNLSLVYEVLDFSYLKRKKYNRFEREIIRKRLIYKSKTKIRKALGKISSLKRQRKRNFVYKLNSFERKIYSKIRRYSKYPLKNAIRNLREQQGQKDKVHLAMKRSKKYLHAMEKIFIKYDIPKELVLLSFVESSFNIKATSSAGAVGVWQIMPNVGKKFLRIDRTMDERRDPIKSTEVAAIILNESYRKLKNWPLVVTSYNVGWPNIIRAQKKIKSKSLEALISKKHSRWFGFAAKNFYAEFIAMVNVCSGLNKDLLEIKDSEPMVFKTMIVKHSSKLRDILFGSKVGYAEFRKFNPEFKTPILLSKVKIPRGTKIKFPNKKSKKKL